jgi:hypothetical protein
MRPVQEFVRLVVVAALLVLGNGVADCLANFQGGQEKDKEASNNKGKIEDTKWSSLETIIKGKKIPAGILKLAFGKDGKLVYQVTSTKYTGTYVLNKGDEVVLRLDRELAGKTEHTEKIAITKDRLTMTDSDGTALTFERLK